MANEVSLINCGNCDLRSRGEHSPGNKRSSILQVYMMGGIWKCRFPLEEQRCLWKKGSPLFRFTVTRILTLSGAGMEVVCFAKWGVFVGKISMPLPLKPWRELTKIPNFKCLPQEIKTHQFIFVIYCNQLHEELENKTWYKKTATPFPLFLHNQGFHCHSE